MFRFGRFTQTGRIYFEGDGAGGGAPAGGADAGAAGAAGGGQEPAGGNGGGAAGGDEKGSGGASESVPYDRFKAVNDEKAAALARAATAEEELKTLKRAGQTDAERADAERADAIARAEAAEKRATDLEKAQTVSERSGWIRDAAAAAKFYDPGDAIARLSSDDLKTAASAERAVKALAEKAPHLVNAEGSSRDAASMLDRVLDPSRASGSDKGDKGSAQVIPADQLEAMNVDQLVALQTRDPELYERSLAAARD